jgi:hypothetical protein
MDASPVGLGCDRGQSLQRRLELRDRLETSNGNRCQRGAEHGARDLGNRAVNISRVWRHAGEEMMEHGPEAVDIAPLVRGVPVEPLGTCVPGARFSGDRRRDSRLPEGWVEGEADELDLRPPVDRSRHQDGVGREIPVNESRPVRRTEARGGLEAEIEGFRQREDTARCHEIR